MWGYPDFCCSNVQNSTLAPTGAVAALAADAGAAAAGAAEQKNAQGRHSRGGNVDWVNDETL
jgi:hypothetical protein